MSIQVTFSEMSKRRLSVSGCQSLRQSTVSLPMTLVSWETEPSLSRWLHWPVHPYCMRQRAELLSGRDLLPSGLQLTWTWPGESPFRRKIPSVDGCMLLCFYVPVYLDVIWLDAKVFPRSVMQALTSSSRITHLSCSAGWRSKERRSEAKGWADVETDLEMDQHTDVQTCCWLNHANKER